MKLEKVQKRYKEAIDQEKAAIGDEQKKLSEELKVLAEKLEHYPEFIREEEKLFQEIMVNAEDFLLKPAFDRESIHRTKINPAIMRGIKPGAGVSVSILDSFVVKDVPASLVGQNIDIQLIGDAPADIKDIQMHGFSVAEIIRQIATESSLQLVDTTKARPAGDLLLPARDNESIQIECQGDFPVAADCVQFFELQRGGANRVVFKLGGVKKAYDPPQNYYSQVTGMIVNTSFCVIGDDFKWNQYREMLQNPPANIDPTTFVHHHQQNFLNYLHLYYSLATRGQMFVVAAGNESMVLATSVSNQILKALADSPITSPYFIMGINLDSDGLHLHRSTCQPGNHERLISRSISAIGSDIVLDNVLTREEQIVRSVTEENPIFSAIMGAEAERRPITGTSFSAPLIAGSLAVLKSRFPEKDITILARLLLDSAVPIVILDGKPWAVVSRPNNARFICSYQMEPGTYMLSNGVKTITSSISRETITLSRSKYGLGRVNLENAIKMSTALFKLYGS